MSAEDFQRAQQATVANEATHVVTCFLLRSDRGRDEILVAHRSDRVRTYQGAWGGISGYVEPGVAPQEQAYTEISEETGLGADSVRLLQTGADLAFYDASANQSWVVHPFLFLTLRPDAVRHDWEAREFAWVEPSALAGMQTVPRLADALAHVYPPAHE